MNHNTGPNAPAPVPTGFAAAYRLAAEADDRDGDEWLGCESLHPLTWLPVVPGHAEPLG